MTAAERARVERAGWRWSSSHRWWSHEKGAWSWPDYTTDSGQWVLHTVHIWRQVYPDALAAILAASRALGVEVEEAKAKS